MRKLAALAVLAALSVGAPAGALAAAPSPVPPHQHYLILPDGTLIPVGPNICSNPADAQGFYAFHQNVHMGTPNLFAFQQPNNPIGFTKTACP